MSVCSLCEAEVPPGESRCPRGHDQLADCPSCGKPRPLNGAPCPSCGYALPPRQSEIPERPSPPSPPRMLRLSDRERTAATMRRPWPTAVDEDSVDRPPGSVRLTPVRSRNWSFVGRVTTLAAVTAGVIALGLYALGRPPAAAPIPTVAAQTVTRPSTTGASNTSRVPATTTTVPTTEPATTTGQTTTRSLVTPLGEPVPVDELRMTIYGIGDLLIGDSDSEVAGRLTSTFGQPDFGSPVEPGLAHPGACPGTASRALRWGILEITFSNDQFVGYRLDQSLGDTGVGTAALRTVSGLQVGATVSTLKTIYAGSYAVVVRDDPERGPSFSLQRYSGEELFWGPVTSIDNGGEVLGIYSPTNCG